METSGRSWGRFQHPHVDHIYHQPGGNGFAIPVPRAFRALRSESLGQEHRCLEVRADVAVPACGGQSGDVVMVEDRGVVHQDRQRLRKTGTGSSFGQTGAATGTYPTTTPSFGATGATDTGTTTSTTAGLSRRGGPYLPGSTSRAGTLSASRPSTGATAPTSSYPTTGATYPTTGQY